MKTYYVYIIGNNLPTIYIGVTNNLARRLEEHKNSLVSGFSKKYHLHKLLYVESFNQIEEAIYREKQLKHWGREWKLELIKESNPNFEDISDQIL